MKKIKEDIFPNGINNTPAKTAWESISNALSNIQQYMKIREDERIPDNRYPDNGRRHVITTKDVQNLVYYINSTINNCLSSTLPNMNTSLRESKLNKVINECVKNVIQERDVQGNQYHDKELNFTHFAVNKTTNKIVNGWDYSGYDSNELKMYKNDYFKQDLIDNELNPKNYTILTFNSCLKRGIDPNNQANWANA